MRFSHIMKKYNKNDSNNKRKNKDGGYTLVELLAIIVILSLIISIVVVVAINIVNKSKEKSYRVTVNNIEKVASSYAIENQPQYEWMDAVDDINNEYFCVTVQDLIDKGYLKNDVLNSNIDENTKVNKDSYIYLERNKLSKSITRNLLLSFYGNEFNNYCNDYKTGKDIEFIEQPTGWAKEKKVIINYKIFNLENDDNISNYKYKYEFLVENKKIDWTNFNNYLETSSIENITSNGVIKAYIMDGSTTIHREYTINGIDKSAPEIELSIDGNNIDESKKLGMEYAKNRNVTIKLVDDQSGLKKGSYTIKYDWSTSNKTCDQLTKSVVINVDGNNSSGKVIIADKTGKGKLYVCGEGVTDNVGNIRGKEIENIDLYLDNIRPVISLGNYNGSSIVSKTVTIPILVTDNDSGVDRSSFVTSDIKVLIGGTELTSGFELSSVDSNNYKLIINNTTLNGNIVLKIKDSNVLDNAKNGNVDVELNTNITFNNTYLIKYDANGGSGVPSIQTKTYGVDLTLSSTKPTRTGYTFLGWSESKTATSATYNAGGKYTKNEDKTLYAVWKINTYTVSFDANGGSGAPNSQTKTYGVDLTLSSTKPTRTGYTFLGWSESKTATSATYNSGGTFSQNNSTTLYAVWKLVSPINSYKCANIRKGTSPYMMEYSGNCTVIDDKNGNWRVKLLTNGSTSTGSQVVNISGYNVTVGILKFNTALSLDAFLVGGGGGGGGANDVNGGSGGGGGYVKNISVDITSGKKYQIFIGPGGSGGIGDWDGSMGGDGYPTYAFDVYANGGKGGGHGVNKGAGGAGGSGGGAGGVCWYSGGNGGSNGGNGAKCWFSAGSDGDPSSDSNSVCDSRVGKGSGKNTREFGESNGDLYAGGGGGGASRCKADHEKKGGSSHWWGFGNGGTNGGGNGGGTTVIGATDSSGVFKAAASGKVNTGSGGGGGRGIYDSGENGGAGGSGIVVIRNKR